MSRSSSGYGRLVPFHAKSSDMAIVYATSYQPLKKKRICSGRLESIVAAQSTATGNDGRRR